MLVLLLFVVNDHLIVISVMHCNGMFSPPADGRHRAHGAVLGEDLPPEGGPDAPRGGRASSPGSSQQNQQGAGSQIWSVFHCTELTVFLVPLVQTNDSDEFTLR